MQVIFFGSTSDSAIVLEKLHSHVSICCVVTQPARPIGRKQIVTPTPIENWANVHKITVVSFPSDIDKPWLYENEQTVIDTLMPFKPDLLVSASYGQKIPTETIAKAIHGGLNVHPSLLPRWRGADPVPWAILAGDHQTGVTVVTLTDKFDEGKIIIQKKLAITAQDEAEPLRARLFDMGADVLVEILPGFLTGSYKGESQNHLTASWARRLSRDDGYIPWNILQKSMGGEDIPKELRPEILTLDISHFSQVVVKALRAFQPWPGVWTTIQTTLGEKRLKILTCHVEPVTNILVLDTVQLEGKKPVSYYQFIAAYPTSVHAT